mmetsp:Transcript_7005/g.21045  ORF Transcript_7005/g.21045 Transcript_7005/m.21045 type:complete len:201 (+) Transcript_7005:867-1469(+)
MALMCLSMRSSVLSRLSPRCLPFLLVFSITTGVATGFEAITTFLAFLLFSPSVFFAACSCLRFLNLSVISLLVFCISPFPSSPFCAFLRCSFLNFFRSKFLCTFFATRSDGNVRLSMLSFLRLVGRSSLSSQLELLRFFRNSRSDFLFSNFFTARASSTANSTIGRFCFENTSGLLFIALSAVMASSCVLNSTKPIPLCF